MRTISVYLITLLAVVSNGGTAPPDMSQFELVLTYQNPVGIATTDVGETAFNDLFYASSIPILYRYCAGCTVGWQHIYYRRFTNLNGSFSVYDYTDNWFEENNVLGTDFNLYSSLDDALNDNNAWTFCNYDDPDIGMFRDCGPTGHRSNEWTSKVRGGHGAAFYVYSLEIFEIEAGTNVCYDSLNYQTGSTFSPPFDGTIVGMRLEHVSGQVSCGGVPALSNWGCYANYGSFVNVINEGTATRVYPTSTTDGITNVQTFGCICDYHFYQITGYDENSPSYPIKDIINPVEVSVNDVFSLQYSEGCCQLAHTDNVGSACANVYLYYIRIGMNYSNIYHKS